MRLRSYLLLLLLLSTSLLLFAKVLQDDSVLGGDTDPYINSLRRKCSENLKYICKTKDDSIKDYLLTLLCLESNLNKLDFTCQKEFFSYKFHLYTNPSLLNSLQLVCGDELSKHCDEKKGYEQVECLFTLDGDKKLRGRCPPYLHQLGLILFSDYSALADIIDGCAFEVDSLNCTVDVGGTGLFGSPVAKIAQCLLGSSGKLTSECANKFTTNRDAKREGGIEENCRTDLVNLCGGAQTKDDKHDCLLSHLIAVRSPQCFEAIVAEDGYHFKTIDMELEFYRECTKDIKKESCAKSEIFRSSSEGEFAKLIDLFQCLEKGSIELSDECAEQVYNHRHVFFWDYDISIELARACDDVREQFCPNNLVRMIDCIKDKVHTDTDKQHEKCAVEVNKLSSAPDLPNRPQSDGPYPDLSYFCEIDLNTVCSIVQMVEYEHKILCLKHHIAEHGVTEVCRNHMGRVQFFFSNQLDSKVFQSCDKEYEGICNTAEPGKKACLLSYYAESTEEHVLSLGCQLEVEDYLQEAAAKRDIEISLFIACLPVLGEYCEPNEGSNIKCLQDHREYIDHEGSCFKHLESYTSMKAPLSAVNGDVYKRCRMAISTYCSKAKDTLSCLQESINRPNLDSDCKSALKEVPDTEWKFDSQLNRNCRGDITFHCKYSVGTQEALRCLTSKLITKELSQKCEFYIRGITEETTPKLTGNELLKRSCQNELKLLCPDSIPEYHLNCLIYLKLDDRVSETCRARIITEEINFVVKKHMTNSFYKQCAPDMTKYCGTGSNVEVLLCLESASDILTGSCKKSLETDLVELNKLQLDKDVAIECHSMAFMECGLKKEGTECLTTLLHDLADSDKECNGDVAALIAQSLLDINKNSDLVIECKEDLTKYCPDIVGQKMHCLYSVKHFGLVKISKSCMGVLNHREEIWRALHEEYPNILRGLYAIIDRAVIDQLMTRSYSYTGFKVMILASLVVSCVAFCCLSRLCRATRSVRRKIM